MNEDHHPVGRPLGEKGAAIDRAELRKRAEEATPGPWKAVSQMNWGNGYAYTSVQPTEPDPETMRHLLMASGEFHVCRMTHTPLERKFSLYRLDADFIAAANPSTVLALLDRIGELEAAVAPFAKAADKIERDYGGDCPDGQLQFPAIAMRDFRRARKALSGE